MSLNLLAFTFPILSLLKTFNHLNPESYKKFDEMPESDQAKAVNLVVSSVLNAENVQGTEHFERIQEMLDQIPGHVGPKTIESLLRYRLKVVKTETDEYPVFTTGTDTENGKYYIGIKPDPEVEQALPWIITHELSHILNDDGLNLSIVKTIASLATAALSVFVLGWSLLPSLGAVMASNCITHTIFSQISERTADDFAIKYCSKEQLEKGIAFFELAKVRRKQGVYASNLITWLWHPSENSRIEKIQRALTLIGKAQTT